MAHKMHPTAMRLGFNKTWVSLWYAEGDKYQKHLHEDLMIRDYLTEKLRAAGLDRVEIARSLNRIEVNVFVARPGVAIGRGGEGIDALKKELFRKMRMNIDVKINEVRKPELSAAILARNVADSMQRGQSPRRIMNMEKDKAMQAGAKGVRIWISGDFGVPKQSRTMKISEGVIPLQTLRADIDFVTVGTVIRNEGLRGIRVWVNRGYFEEEDKKEN